MELEIQRADKFAKPARDVHALLVTPGGDVELLEARGVIGKMMRVVPEKWAFGFVLWSLGMAPVVVLGILVVHIPALSLALTALSLINAGLSWRSKKIGQWIPGALERLARRVPRVAYRRRSLGELVGFGEKREQVLKALREARGMATRAMARLGIEPKDGMLTDAERLSVQAQEESLAKMVAMGSRRGVELARRLHGATFEERQKAFLELTEAEDAQAILGNVPSEDQSRLIEMMTQRMTSEMVRQQRMQDMYYKGKHYLNKQTGPKR